MIPQRHGIPLASHSSGCPLNGRQEGNGAPDIYSTLNTHGNVASQLSKGDFPRTRHSLKKRENCVGSESSLSRKMIIHAIEAYMASHACGSFSSFARLTDLTLAPRHPNATTGSSHRTD
eukprot:1160888-Pelagomonas_calceolata.AAC.9